MKLSLTHVLVGIGIGVGLSTALQLGVIAAQQAPAPGRGRGGGGFTEPSPMDFHDHEGYIPIFDGKTLDGWDGNPKFWRVADGAIVGESRAANPSGNIYIAYRK